MKYILALLVLAGAYQWYTSKDKGFTGERHEQLIMYSLTTCGYCNQKRKELKEVGIGFVEYFIDKDSGKQAELNHKLSKSGYPPRDYGTPIFDAYGYMVPDNPEIPELIAMRDKD